MLKAALLTSSSAQGVNNTREFEMANAIASVLPLHKRAMPFLAHLEELRKRILLSILGIMAGFLLCWSLADRLFGLMQRPIILALRHHGIGGGLVYLNPTEPFNLYLMVAFVFGCSLRRLLSFINYGCLSLPDCTVLKGGMFFLS